MESNYYEKLVSQRNSFGKSGIFIQFKSSIRLIIPLVHILLFIFFQCSPVSAEQIYDLIGSYTGPQGVFDVTIDGRIIAINGDNIILERSVGSGIYDIAGQFNSGLIAPWGASFISVSPDGTRLVIGDNYFEQGHVYLVNYSDLNGGLLAPAVFQHENYEAAWMDNSRIAITYANPDNNYRGEVAVLDLFSHMSTPVITIGGASAGISFDIAGNLYTGNGYDYLMGGSETGQIRGFNKTSIEQVLTGQQRIIDFDNSGIIIGDLLTAGSLRFDQSGNLFTGGGDLYGGSGDYEYFAIMDGNAIDDSWYSGEPVSWDNIYCDDPETSLYSTYVGRYNQLTDEWLVGSTDFSVIYRYKLIPEPGSIAVILIVCSMLFIRRKK